MSRCQSTVSVLWASTLATTASRRNSYKHSGNPRRHRQEPQAFPYRMPFQRSPMCKFRPSVVSSAAPSMALPAAPPPRAPTPSVSPAPTPSAPRAPVLALPALAGPRCLLHSDGPCPPPPPSMVDSQPWQIDFKAKSCTLQSCITSQEL